MKHKILKCHLGTWRKLRGKIKGLPNETMDEYLKRIIRGLENDKL